MINSLPYSKSRELDLPQTWTSNLVFYINRNHNCMRKHIGVGSARVLKKTLRKYQNLRMTKSAAALCIFWNVHVKPISTHSPVPSHYAPAPLSPPLPPRTPSDPFGPLGPPYARSKIAASSWLIKNGTNHLPRKIGQIVSPTLKSFQNELSEEGKFQCNEFGFRVLILGIQN